MELAASAGLLLDPWQSEAVHVALGEQDDGRWAAREVGIIVPRQNGKGSILEAIVLAALFLFDEQLILWSAHEFKTASEAYLRVKTLIEQTPDLRQRVAKFHGAHGAEGVELKSGARLRFVARTSGSGRGFSPDRVILDEAMNLWAKSVSALLFSMSARPNTQMIYTSSAPLASEESEVLRALCRRGRAGTSARLAYIEYSAREGADLRDPAAWAAANPGFPHRISGETIESELDAATDPDDFARERLGLYVEQEGAVDRVITAAAWATTLDESSKRNPDVSPGVALDVSPDGKSAAIAVSDGIHGEVADYAPGTAWVPERIKAILERLEVPAVILDPKGPAGALLVDLIEADVEFVKVTPEQHAQACGGLLNAINHEPIGKNDTLRFRHLAQPVLDAAVQGAIRRPYGDSWAWSRRNSTVDISPLVALTLAQWGAHNMPDAPQPFFASWA